ncbi:flagellar hook-basal body complex protein FliE [Robertmurraya siralis]|uniref:Flagellar hook-basal body complex protein FliE n=1 Tax=Robertmurraya siralis TaxID=77777 RepID=A0A920BTR6_9BACI|nr:flagellar hook-basal body complex protein FliE [Robertmurraya siralis]PAE21384.1 flagellar hook-basal body complex protein FliE [Bacillus sp. 7504-2]GIN61522.1 flagellar hook-basal body complex protein FliE [Robertmurraya siralis]
MNNISFPNVSSVLPVTNEVKTSPVTPYEAQKSFASVLKQSIEKVNEAQVQSDVMTEKLARGENVDLHQVMIASQKASITLQATMEIRNKVIEAYQEVMRMQV